MPVLESSIPEVLRDRANQQPDATAFTFIDYEHDWAGFTESLTWSQMYRRTRNVARELKLCGSTGDRALILAPQGLDYIAGFLGALEAGLIAVPLMAPAPGIRDELVHSVLQDCSPSVILTTSSVAATVAEYGRPERGQGAPSVVEVDAMDLDAPTDVGADGCEFPNTAYLQYTSGSTREPAGVVVSYRNLISNFEHVNCDYFEDYGRAAPPDTTVVSWVPLNHNMGLFLGVCAPILSGIQTVLMSPVSFLQRPARWVQLMASNSRAFSPAPNFAFELAVRTISDDDMAGLDLGGVLGIISGGERIHPATLRRFTERFAHFNLRDTAIRPSYGLAEATVYVATAKTGNAPEIAWFDSEALAEGQARRCTSGEGLPLISYGVLRTSTVRVVDPETRTENAGGAVGEIWVHGDNVASGYGRKLEQTQHTFGATLVDPSAGTPEGPWLRTGDLGVISSGELFIMGRIKELLIVDGRNHYPDDIEATGREITGGRVVAISVPGDGTERPVVIIEVDTQSDSDDALRALRAVKREVAAAISTSHGLTVTDIVVVSPFSIPLTRSGKVRRSACVERYQRGEFTRLDSTA